MNRLLTTLSLILLVFLLLSNDITATELKDIEKPSDMIRGQRDGSIIWEMSQAWAQDLADFKSGSISQITPISKANQSYIAKKGIEEGRFRYIGVDTANALEYLKIRTFGKGMRVNY